MPFGLKNAPATFQRMMDRLLAGLEHECVVYMDDIIVFAKDEQSLAERLEHVFERLAPAGLRLNPDKCEFVKSSLDYLGHIVSADGVQPNAQKVEAIAAMPPPKDIKQVRSFLGGISYYREYVPDVATLAAPLHK